MRLRVLFARWALAGLAAAPACAGSGPEEVDSGGERGFDAPRGGAVIALAGDAMLGRGIDHQLAEDPSFEPFRELEAHTADVEVFAFNLETTITVAQEEWPGKNYHFKMDPERAALAFDRLPVPKSAARVVSLANNHVLDFHEAGLRETIATLDELGIVRTGAGLDVAEAHAPAIVTTPSGVRIGILSASSHCSCGSDAWRAGESTPGMWQIESEPGADWDELATAVTDLRHEVDWVVVSLHWGPNWVERWPIEWMRELASVVADAGASVIVGHSAHHVLPIEEIEGATVLYGTGDFIDDYGPVEGYRPDLSYLAKLRLSPETGPQLEIVPLRIEHDPEHFVHPLETDDPDYARVRAAAQR